MAKRGLSPESMKIVDEFLNLPYSVIVQRMATTQDNVTYSASHPELPGCRGQGDTPQAAKDDLAEARRLYIEDLLESGERPPVPRVYRPQ